MQGKEGKGITCGEELRVPNSTADIRLGHCVGGRPEHCGVFSIVRGPHPFNARSTLSVTTRYPQTSPGIPQVRFWVWGNKRKNNERTGFF